MASVSFAKLYDRGLAPLERMFLSNWRKETLGHLPPESDILEIGAGTGLNFPHYPDAAFSVASELSEEMLTRAKLKTDTPFLVRADGEKLPFADNSFDAAIATLVFCSIENPGAAFAELSRVIKDKGRIVMLEHVRPGGLSGYVFDVLSRITVALFGDHFNRQTALLATQSGLKILDVKNKAFGIVNLIVCEVRK